MAQRSTKTTTGDYLQRINRPISRMRAFNLVNRNKIQQHIAHQEMAIIGRHPIILEQAEAGQAQISHGLEGILETINQEAGAVNQLQTTSNTILVEIITIQVAVAVVGKLINLGRERRNEIECINEFIVK